MKQTLESWLSEGPFTLALCSHFFGFYQHTALLEELYQSPFRPHRITGISAGALVGGALASGLTPLEFKNLMFLKQARDYLDPHMGLGLLKGKKFLSILQNHFVQDFSETQIPFEAGVVELPRLKLRFLKSGSLPQAILASCAVPGLFPPVKINSVWNYDGGLLQKSGVSPTDQHQRVLDVYLDRTHLLPKWARLNPFVRSRPQHRQLYLPLCGRVNPLDLNTGKQIFEKTRERARGLLKLEFQGTQLVIP